MLTSYDIIFYNRVGTPRCVAFSFSLRPLTSFQLPLHNLYQYSIPHYIFHVLAY